MDLTTKAIALRSADYKENDKLVTLYSLEYGKITVHARGVKKSTAKLKFATDMFCFGNYELATTGDRYTLKTCQQTESFYTIREDVTTYYAGCVIAECLLSLTEDGQSDGKLFVETLKALQALCCNNNPLVVTLRYLLKFLELNGFKLDFGVCCNCASKTDNVYLDAKLGGVVCENCRTVESVAVAKKVVTVCNMTNELPYDKLKNLNFTNEMLKDSLAVINRHIAHSFVPLKSLAELIKLS